MPADPATCRPAALFDRSICHPAGSAVPSFQIFAEIVVTPATVFVSATRRYFAPGVITTPLSTAAPTAVLAPRNTCNRAEPSAATRTRTMYWSSPTRRVIAPTYIASLILSTENVAENRVDTLLITGVSALTVDAPGNTALPTPSPTENRVAPVRNVHAPPASAEPQPDANCRPNASANNGPAGAGVSATATCDVCVAVAPRSSVTVNVTAYVPGAPYVCDAVAPVAVTPSPKSHPNDTTVPSRSDDPEPSTDTANRSTTDTNDATGTTFAGVTVTNCVAAFVAPSSSVTVRVTTYVPPAA